MINEHFFFPRWYSIFINPYFIDRYSLLRAVRKFSAQVKPEDKILDVGCGLKPYSRLFSANEYVGIDIDGGGHDNQAKKTDKYYNGRDIPYDDNIFDAIICTQVLEHTEDPNFLVKEMLRVLKPRAVIFLSVPFLGNEHEQPYDFWRFTQFGNKKLLTEAGFADIVIYPTCGFFSTFGQMFSSFIFESIKIRNSLLKLILSVFILAPIQALSIFLDIILPNKRLTLNYIITAKK